MLDLGHSRVCGAADLWRRAKPAIIPIADAPLNNDDDDDDDGPAIPQATTARLLRPFTMSLDPPAYIVSLQNNIRARPISWEGAVRAKTITDAELKQIKSIDKVRKEVRKHTIESDVDATTTLFFGSGESKSIFTAAAKREDITQYLLVLISDVLDGESDHVCATRDSRVTGTSQTCLHSPQA